MGISWGRSRAWGPHRAGQQRLWPCALDLQPEQREPTQAWAQEGLEGGTGWSVAELTALTAVCLLPPRRWTGQGIKRFAEVGRT